MGPEPRKFSASKIFPRQIHTVVLVLFAQMALYRYFKQQSNINDKLPDPQGALSMKVPSTSIVSANEEVRHVVSKGPAQKRGSYTKFTAEQRGEIGKRAAEYGIVAAIRYYSKKYPDLK